VTGKVRLAAKTRLLQSRMKTIQPEASTAGGGTRQFAKPKALAARVGVSKKTLFRWADAGKIHRFKVNGRLVLLDELEVVRFVESARVAVVP
jgi:excisionase family DNA binding protein